MSGNVDVVRAIELVPLKLLGREALEKILAIRNQEGVRKWMYTSHEIPIDEHLAWVERVTKDPRSLVFAVCDRGADPIGLVSANSIDRLHRKTDWSYYLDQTARGGLGKALEYTFINFVFFELGFEKLNCEVIEGNIPVINIHKKFLFKEEGFRRSNIEKDGKRLGVHFLGLTSDEWIIGKDGIFEQIKYVFDRFEVTFHSRP